MVIMFALSIKCKTHNAKTNYANTNTNLAQQAQGPTKLVCFYNVFMQIIDRHFYFTPKMIKHI